MKPAVDPDSGSRTVYSPVSMSTGNTRLIGLAAALIGLALLGTAAMLSPAAGGIGTHQRLGLPACGWITSANLPCPTCGMTTAFSHTVRGEWGLALAAQPMGLVLCLVAAMAIVGGLWALMTGAPVGQLVLLAWNRWWTWGLIVLFLLAWGYKVAAHRGLL